MPRPSKWLTDVSAEAPVEEAARAALAPRLSAVRKLLQAAAQTASDPEDNVEAVHQLRIWTRRAGAALRLFDEALPPKQARWFRRRLRKIRRQAGMARDSDVLGSQLTAHAIEGTELAAVHLRKARRQSEHRLLGLYRKLVESGRWKRRQQRLLRKLTKRQEASEKNASRPPFGPWCRAELAQVYENFATAAGQSLRRRDNLHVLRRDKLHALRIAGKRLRYALELAPAALPTKVHKSLCQELSDLQERLGKVCDQLATLAHVKEWLAETHEAATRRTLRDWQTAAQRELAAEERRFARWWTDARRSRLAARWQKGLSASSRRKTD
ncbi:MAG: CHAD domain-containing protein [Pirellulaceae bacterium]|jgi:CHAD domain-containing protein|nr:CHAD domain-containing protein [Pirellulaceae bacterium]